MALENNFMRRAEKTNDTRLGRAPVESGSPTLAQLSEEPEFGLYLDSLPGRGLKETWVRYMGGESTEADMQKLIAQHKEYKERKKGFKALFSTMEDYTEDMVKSSPEFRDLSDMNGAENIRAVLKQGLLEMAMKDPSEFARVQAEYRKLRDFEENVEKPLDARIKAWCDKHGIPEDGDLRAAMLEPSALRRQQLIKHHMMKTMSAGQLVKDGLKALFGFRSTSVHARELAREDLPSLIAQREQLTKDAGMYARDLLVKNKEFRTALSRMRAGKEPPFREGAETKMAMSEMPHARRSAADAAWNQYKADNGVTDFSTLAPDAQDDMRNKFSKAYENEYFKDMKGGFWYWVARLLFGQAMKKEVLPHLK